jgi:DNA-binding transcriptional MocR family regulator
LEHVNNWIVLVHWEARLSEEWTPVLKSQGRGLSKHRILADAIVSAIEAGELRSGQRMPTHRALAASMGISVQTVGNAYKEVERRGYLRGEVGRGTFVAGRVTDSAHQFMLDARHSGLTDLSTIRAVFTDAHSREVGAVMAQMGGGDVGTWLRPCRPIAGLHGPREVGAEWLRRFALDVEPERLILTNGTSQSIFLALATVVQDGDLVLTEGLTDHGVIGCAHVLGFSLRGLPTDKQGLLPDAFERACRESPVRAIVCTPTFSNPTMHLADAERRRAIADVARRYGVYVVEDDVYGGLVSQPLPSICGMVPELGFYCTSFTKTIAAGLRTGYLVVPPKLTIRAGSVLRVTGWMATPLFAEMAARMIVEGRVEELIALQRRELEWRQSLVAEMVGEHVIGAHDYAPAAWLQVPEYWEEEAVVAHLRERGVAVTASDPFLVPPTAPPRAVRICLGGAGDEGELRHGLGVISDTFSKYPAINATEFT